MFFNVNKKIKMVIPFVLLFVSSLSFANVVDSRQDIRDLRSMVKTAKKIVRVHLKNYPVAAEDFERELDPLSVFQTFIPNVSEAPISSFEEIFLTAYLDDPTSSDLSQLMAVYHLLKSPAFKRYAGNQVSISEFKSTVFALYFLKRAKRLGASASWVERAVIKTQTLLSDWLPLDEEIDHSIGTFAQNYFLDAFTTTESLRYSAEAMLVEDLLEDPMNIQTNFYVAAANLWNAGEARYADPNMLYAYVLCAFMAERVERLAVIAQDRWVENDGATPLFNLSNESGFFTLPSRRWLALLHGDQDEVALINQEVDAWLQLFPQLYGFVAAAVPFDEPESFQSAAQAYFFSIDACIADPIRVCTDTPKAPFNRLAYELLGADVLLKSNDSFLAGIFLTFNQDPTKNFDLWFLGQEAWNHRIDNFDAILALYQNDDTSDDPGNDFINRQKWGTSSTCQLCHQRQGLVIDNEDIYEAHPGGLDFTFISDRPQYSVTWYGDAIIFE